MKFAGRFAPLAVFATCFALTTALAQSNPPVQTPQNPQDQSQPVTGVSQPPADDTITTDEDVTPPAAASIPKPSAAIPMTPAQPAAVAPALRPRNFEDDIVTSAPSSTSATLSRREWNPDEDIVSVVPSNPNELGSGTNIRVRLSEDLSTVGTQKGASFRATVDHDVYKDGRIIIPVGAEMRGRVVQVSQGHHIGP